MAVLEVEDTGLGIPAEEQERLFERFFRSSSATENAIPGTGLGLTITKAIVERHGGQIEVESAENAGTTVSIRLPLRAKQRTDVVAAVHSGR
jgi:signal transduction histidine kinase